ncbi:phage tail protein [Pseudomonas sp. GZD-222]|uniref:phage tail protein n=1 Tax=Pseudomonas sp. GZD-222 TaxID=3404805 RepID=UPI003BB63C58
MSWYRQGTVAITAGQNTVTGTGTAFSVNTRVGDALQGPDGRWYEVTNIASATVLSILPAYQGSTVSGGTYGLAPMQGYVKESADRLRQFVNDWGSTLAGLGSVSTEDVVPVVKGGTGGTTPALARSGLQLKSAAVADIVGTISVSGGTPSGAIFEKGSNANGTYIKFADGTLIASMEVPPESLAPGGYKGFVWTYPVSFGWAPIVIPAATLNFTSAIGPVSAYCDNGSSHTFVQTRVAIRNSDTVAQAVGARIVAIGRWY